MANNNHIIDTTKSWIERVVIGCNFCPFARPPFVAGKIHYEVVHTNHLEEALFRVLLEYQRLDQTPSIETTLVIFPDSFADFDDYLELLHLCEGMIVAHQYEGVYQVASFHPDYRFANSNDDDPANYTNRSPYPMIHLLREDSVAKAIGSHPDVAHIPSNNITFAREKGLAYMKALKEGPVGPTG